MQELNPFLFLHVLYGGYRGADQSIVSRAAVWFGKKGKLKLLSDFAAENWETFADELDNRDDGTGFKIEYDLAHKDFLKQFEEELELFLEDEQSDLATFEKEAREVQEGKSLTLFENEDSEHRKFLDAMLSSLDFEHFLGEMVKMARNKSRAKGKSKSGRSKK